MRKNYLYHAIFLLVFCALQYNSYGTSLLYSTLLGGNAADLGIGIVIDDQKNVYIVGNTNSPNFPIISGSYDTALNNYDDIFVCKLTPDGSALLYSTYLGGNSSDDARGIAIDSTGSVYITGRTASSDFPATSGAYSESPTNGIDAFVTKIDPTGSSLEYSTFIGGNQIFDEIAYGIAVDTGGQAYITGYTTSTDFPVTAGALDTTFGGGEDMFVTKFNSTGTGLIYSTYIAGSNFDEGQDIVVDLAGNAYITGDTYSYNFPVTAGAFDTVFRDTKGVVVCKLNPLGSAFVYSTFLQSTSSFGVEGGYGIAIDSSGNAYVTGATQSVNFPVTPGAFDKTYGGGYFWGDAFVSKLNPSGSALVYSTFLGGAEDDLGLGINVDNDGNCYLVGYTVSSSDFPVTTDAYDQTYNGGSYDAFIVKINPTGSNLVYSSLFGGSSTDLALDMVLDNNNVMYITGHTTSPNFPTTAGAYDQTPNGSNDAFAIKFSIIPQASVDSNWKIFE